MLLLRCGHAVWWCSVVLLQQAEGVQRTWLLYAFLRALRAAVPAMLAAHTAGHCYRACLLWCRQRQPPSPPAAYPPLPCLPSGVWKAVFCPPAFLSSARPLIVPTRAKKGSALVLAGPPQLSPLRTKERQISRVLIHCFWLLRAGHCRQGRLLAVPLPHGQVQPGPQAHGHGGEDHSAGHALAKHMSCIKSKKSYSHHFSLFFACLTDPHSWSTAGAVLKVQIMAVPCFPLPVTLLPLLRPHA